ncbi:hypothetical protein, partial [Mesorhizobium sp.]|uniref:hypothetical protein n=1 Tax=Mesorhizobium sp. TaxID=1871066 RepID=UPI00257D9DA2
DGAAAIAAVAVTIAVAVAIAVAVTIAVAVAVAIAVAVTIAVAAIAAAAATAAIAAVTIAAIVQGGGDKGRGNRRAHVDLRGGKNAGAVGCNTAKREIGFSERLALCSRKPRTLTLLCGCRCDHCHREGSG